MSSSKQSNLDILFEHDFDVRNRVMYLNGDVDQDKADKFIKIIMFLDKTAGDIIIVLNSEGGCVTNGLAIYDVIKSCQNEVVIKVVGAAMSISSIILQAGDKRIATKHARLMIHRGSASMEGNLVDVEKAVKETKQLDKMCVDIYFEKLTDKNPDFKRNKLEKMMDYDTYISAEEALELGFVDDID